MHLSALWSNHSSTSLGEMRRVLQLINFPSLKKWNMFLIPPTIWKINKIFWLPMACEPSDTTSMRYCTCSRTGVDQCLIKVVCPPKNCLEKYILICLASKYTYRYSQTRKSAHTSSFLGKKWKKEKETFPTPSIGEEKREKKDKRRIFYCSIVPKG